MKKSTKFSNQLPYLTLHIVSGSYNKTFSLNIRKLRNGSNDLAFPWRRIILIVEDPTVTVKCRTAIKQCSCTNNLCLSVMLDSLSCSFTFITFLLIRVAIVFSFSIS